MTFTQLTSGIARRVIRTISAWLAEGNQLLHFDERAKQEYERAVIDLRQFRRLQRAKIRAMHGFIGKAVKK